MIIEDSSLSSLQVQSQKIFKSPNDIACRHPVYAKNISLRDSKRTPKRNFQKKNKNSNAKFKIQNSKLKNKCPKKNSKSKVQNPKISLRDCVQKNMKISRPETEKSDT